MDSEGRDSTPESVESGKDTNGCHTERAVVASTDNGVTVILRNSVQFTYYVFFMLVL